MHSNSKEVIRARLDQLPDHILWAKEWIRSLPTRPRGWKVPYVSVAAIWLLRIRAITTCSFYPTCPKILVRDVVEGANSHAHWKRKLEGFPMLQGSGDYSSSRRITLPEALYEYATLHQTVRESGADLDFEPLKLIEKTIQGERARAKAGGYRVEPERIAIFDRAKARAKELRHDELGRFYVIPFLFQRPLDETEVHVLAAIEFELTRKASRAVKVGKGMRRFGGSRGYGYKLFGHSQSWIEKCGLYERNSPDDPITKEERVAISRFLKAVATLERDFQLKLVAKRPDGKLLDFAGVKKLVSGTRGRKCDNGHPSLKALADLVVWFEAPKDYLKIWREVFYKHRGLCSAEQNSEAT